MSLASALTYGCAERASQPETSLTRAELQDPNTCAGCHPGQHEEWAGSMHAYASFDPVFRALNQRGQEETGGKLGDFCVNCHAPLAVRAGLTTDGLNLDEVPATHQGINCYFCHNVDRVTDDHNNALELRDDTTMLGPLRDAASNRAHPSAYSPLLDANELDSARMCGSCHDVKLPDTLVEGGFHLERTFLEWQETLFNRDVAAGGVTCNGCHMPVSAERDRVAATKGSQERRSRRHDFEGIDVATTPFFGANRQRLLVQQFLASSLLAELCVSEAGSVRLTLENVGSGHSWPSGSTHLRHPWLELKAYDEAETLSFEVASPEQPNGETSGEAIEFDDKGIDVAGNPTHTFWEIAGFGESNLLPGVATLDAFDDRHHRERRVWDFELTEPAAGAIERVTLLVRMRPVKLEVLDDLVATGHLAQTVVDALPVLDVLPNACFNGTLPGAASGNLAVTECDGEPDRAFTLVWRRSSEVKGAHKRQTTLDGQRTVCWAHASFAP